jgi:hypothetical protein
MRSLIWEAETMTNPPERKVEYRMPNELEHLYSEHGIESEKAEWTRRNIVDATFEHGKAGHWETIHERGEVFTDASGIRAVIFHYKHSDGRSVRSIKRLVVGDVDYRLPQPNASSPAV